MFESLLKFPIEIFNRGDFHFGIRLPGLILFLVLVGLGVASVFAYRAAAHRTTTRFRGFLVFLRTVALCGLAFCLLKPFVTIYQTSPDDSYLLLLVDQSKSMQITDTPNQGSRLALANDLLFNPDTGLIDDLSSKFKTRVFAFSDIAKRVVPAPLDVADGETTNIPMALEEALEKPTRCAVVWRGAFY